MRLRIILSCLFLLSLELASAAAPVSLFDGKSLDGWEGDAKWWRVEDGALTGGSRTEKVPRNFFLATARSFHNFDLRLKLKLTGVPGTGMINSGVQIRSLRVPNSAEMSGYQVDAGDGWWGKMYDESRRNKVIGEARDLVAVNAAVKKDDWNEFRIRTDGPRIQSWINGVPALDYTEADPQIAQDGHIAVQIHSGGMALVQVKEVTIEELPPTPNAPTWEKLGGVEAARAKVQPPRKGAEAIPAPKRDISYNAVASAAKTPEEERALLKVPDGFEVELVAAEDPANGIGKFVPIAFDQRGALWTTTALEYPVDGNENPAAADALYASKAKDKVLVYDRDPSQPTGYSPKARVFAEGLAIPLGVLPFKNGCYVQHGHDIAFLEDTDADGRADRREVILTGFGVQDSHLFPHQFLRAPGGWIWMAQGAFNYSKVRRPDEPVEKAVQFDQTRMAKFRPDGSGFDITSNGPCNIWGLVLNGEGEAFIQEANDFGYPVMPFHEYANYPGCSDRQWKSYAPEFPGTAPDFKMGGTGLSGLALLDAGWAKLLDEVGGAATTMSSRAERSGVENRSAAEMAAGEGGRKSQTPAGSGGAEPARESPKSSAPPLPAKIRDSSTPLRSARNDGSAMNAQTVLIANPITNRIQAIKMHRDGQYWKLDKPQDFLVSEDPWFRPIAITIGPDGCLYIVDWYNKIISHNEVPRAHPDRDKTRGRIWRVKAKAQKPFHVSDFTKLSGDELLAKLGGPSLAQHHLAWQTIVDRGMKELLPPLQAIARGVAPAPARAVSGALAGRPNVERPPGEAPAGVREARTLSDATRIAALWALRELGDPDLWDLCGGLATKSVNRNVRREAVAAYPAGMSVDWFVETLQALLADPDPEVRSLMIRRLSEKMPDQSRNFEAFTALLMLARAPLPEPVAPSTRNGKPIKVREAYDREFERYLVRMFLERQPEAVAKFLDSDAAKPLPVEARLLASLALEPKASAARVAKLLPNLQRAPDQEEVLRLAQFPDEPGVGEALRAALNNPATRSGVLEALLATRTRLEAAKLTPMLAEAAHDLLGKDGAAQELGIRLAASFKLASVEPALLALAEKGATASPALRALSEIGSTHSELFAKLAETAADPVVREAALGALAASKAPEAPAKVLALYPKLTPTQRRTVLERLSGTKPGARALVAALTSGEIAAADLDGPTIDRLQTVLGTDDPALVKLVESLGELFRPVLGLDGTDAAWSQTSVTLDGPCTIEAWVRLDPESRKIGNADGILGAPGQLDFNFFGEKARIYAFPPLGDVAVAKKPIMAGLWTHLAATRDAAGIWKIYLDGEFDATGNKPAPGKIENARIAWTAAKGGTRGALGELRVWNRARTADEIRNTCDRSLGKTGVPPVGTELPGQAGRPTSDLVFNSTADGWGKLQAGAKVIKTSDFPPILTPDEAVTLDVKYAKFRALAEKPGDVERGKVAAALCQACHLFGTTGGNIGPNLSGVGAMGTEAILRNILQPNAAMENGYRIYRVELKNGDLVDALFVSEDKDAVIVRLPGSDDRRIAKTDIRETKYLRRSLMPEALLDTMTPEQVSDLFAYLQTLK